jgi:hypothetical protein
VGQPAANPHRRRGPGDPELVVTGDLARTERP